MWVLGSVWGLSCVTFLPAFADRELSRTALALLPWMLFAGWPATRPSAFVERSLPALALALPVIVLTVSLDRSSGLALQRSVALGGCALVLATVLSAARSAASRSSFSPRAVHAGLWFLGCLLLPLLAVTTRPDGLSSGWRAIASSASPLAWLLAQIPADATRPGGPWGVRAPWICAAYVLLLWLPVAWSAQSCPEPEERA